MPVCAVSTCRNTSSSVGNSGVTFHPFPRHDKRSLEWFIKCKRKDKIRASTTDRICSAHFTQDAYERDIGHELLGQPPNPPKLKATATPTQNLPYINIKPSEARKVLTPTLARQLKRRPQNTRNTSKTQSFRRSISLEERGSSEAARVTCVRRSVSLGRPQLPTVNEEMTTIDDKTVRLVSKTHCETLLGEIFNDESLMDLTISIDQKRIRAHRVVLQQASGFFKRNLMNEEASTSSEYLIRLNNISYDDMSRLMAFIYHGEVAVKASDLDRFLEATEFLDVQDLKEHLRRKQAQLNNINSTPSAPEEPKCFEDENRRISSQTNGKDPKREKNGRCDSRSKEKLKKFAHERSKKKLRQGLVATLFLLY